MIRIGAGKEVDGGGYGVTTITAQDTWTPTIVGPDVAPGMPAFIPVETVITGGAIVTAQTRRGSGAWIDMGDTAGVANAATLLKPFDGLILSPGREYRVGVKTGNLNGGSAVITVG